MEKFLIFLTVGTQLPFDRLVNYALRYLQDYENVKFILQVGKNGVCPEDIECYQEIEHKKYNEILSKVDLIVAHCGMGVILTAAEIGKPIICCPRDASKNEHRNNHQFDTASAIQSFIPIVLTYEDFKNCVEEIKSEKRVMLNDKQSIVDSRFISELEALIKK